MPDIVHSLDLIYYVIASVITAAATLIPKLCKFITIGQSKAMDVIMDANDDLIKEKNLISKSLDKSRSNKMLILTQLAKTQSDMKLLKFKYEELLDDIKKHEG